MDAWWVTAGSPGDVRSFDPFRIADLEYRMWVGYYQRRWTQVLAASVRLFRLGFGKDWVRTLQGAWLMLRAVQLWAPFPDNDPDGARACMCELYALVRLRFGEPADPARAAALEVDWWRAHRERQHAPDPAETGDELVESVARLYCYLFGETEAAVSAGRSAPGASDGSVRSVGPGGLPARQPAAPAGARRAGPRLRRAPRRRPSRGTRQQLSPIVTATASFGSVRTPADEIEHLAQLHASGALSDDEFTAAEAKYSGPDRMPAE